jgi:hypothetical protein
MGIPRVGVIEDQQRDKEGHHGEHGGLREIVQIRRSEFAGGLLFHGVPFHEKLLLSSGGASCGGLLWSIGIPEWMFVPILIKLLSLGSKPGASSVKMMLI